MKTVFGNFVYPDFITNNNFYRFIYYKCTSNSFDTKKNIFFFTKYSLKYLKKESNRIMKCNTSPPKLSVEFPLCFEKYSGKWTNCNPGNIAEFHLLAQRLRPTVLNGIELDYHHRLSANKSFIANCVLSHNKPSGFRFGGIYYSQMQGNVMETPKIRADINPSTLSTNINLLYYPVRCLRLEMDLQRAGVYAPLEMQACMELCRQSATLTANLYEATTDRARATFSYLQAASDHLALGSELLVEWMAPKSFMPSIAVAARYKRHSYALAATASLQGIDVSYWQRLHKRLQMASLWAWHRKLNKSIGTVCYQWEFQDAHVRGMIDSNLSLGFMYSRFLTEIPLSLAFSLLLNLHTNRFLFGLRLVLDPSGLRKGE